MPPEVVSPLLAHAFGERYESPVPLALFVLSGAAVVLLSFGLVARREVAGAGGGVVAEQVAVPRGSRIGAPISLLVLAVGVFAGLAGNQVVSENIVPTAFWVYLWVGLPLVVGVVGDFTGPLNPFAAIARAAGAARARKAVLGTERPMDWPAGLGYWPAVLFYFLLVEGELVFNAQAILPRVIAVGLVVYALVCLAGGLVFGGDAWCGRAEVFSVLFSTWGKLGFFRFGAPGRRGFAGGLDRSFDPSPSRVTFALLLLVSVTFDGVLSTPQWTRFSTGLPGSPAPGTGEHDLLATSTLLLLTVAMFLGFGAFAYASGRAGEHGDRLRQALTGLLPSLLPISYGYLLAHYSQYLLINGQLLIPQLGNPLGGANSFLPYPFNDDYVVNTGVLPTSVLWYVQIVVIVLAHVVAVLLAHRYLAQRAADHRLALRSEWPWLAAMVAYTMISLWLLAQPLVQEPAQPAALGRPAASAGAGNGA